MKSLKSLLCLVMVCALHNARAVLTGPYVPDANTLHLWHLDEFAVPCQDAASSGALSLNGLINGATLGNMPFPGFAGCLNTLGTSGLSAWTNGAPITAGLFASPGTFSSSDANTLTYTGPTGAFTMEMMVCPLFPVATNFGAPAKGGTGRSAINWQLMDGESGISSNRLWQWRLDPVGSITNTTLFPAPGTNASPVLDFIAFTTPGVATKEVFAVIPTNGPNAIASNQWFHVAITYSGVSNTAGNFNFYWTAVNSNTTTANLILSTNLPNNLAGPSGSPCFCIGNSGRSDNGNWLGLIDEVRISSVARSATGMMFAPTGIGLSPLASETVAAGATVTLTSSVSGDVPTGFQWLLNGSAITAGSNPNISGFNSNTLVISNITVAEAGAYQLMATNSTDTNSTSATLFVGLTITPLSNETVGQGSTIALTSTVNGASGLQWQFDGTNITALNSPNISGFNSNTLVISNITMAEAGTYTFIATNVNSTNTTSAVLTVWQPVPGLFNTGVDTNGALLPGGSVDPHWQLVESADPTFTGPNAIVDSTVPGTYVAEGPFSEWISPGDNANVAGGYYEYQTSFYMDSENLTNMELTVNWAADNICLDVLLNGVDLGITDNNGFSVFVPTVITNNFVLGSNTLICVVSNLIATGPNVSAFRAELSGLSAPLPPTAVQIITGPTNVTALQFQNASFNVTAFGSGPLAYQWYLGASPLSGQTSHLLNLNNLSGAQAGTYTVVVTNSFSTNTAAAVLTVITPDTLEWQGLVSGDWDLTTTNWLDTTISADVAFSQNSDVVFDNAGSSQPNVTLDLPVTPNSMVVGANTSYTLADNGGYLAGNFNLVLNGPGSLILDAPNTYSGNTIIQGGTLQIGNNDADGTVGSSAVSNGAALVFNRVDTFTFANTISGPGTVTMSGSGTAVLTASNTYTGATVVSAGALQPSANAALGNTSGVTVTDGGELFMAAGLKLGNIPLTLGGVGSDTGALFEQSGAAGTYGGPITLSDAAGIVVDTGGTLDITNAAGIVGSNIDFTFQGNSTTSSGIVSGPVSLSTGSLTELGFGTLELISASNNWTGGTMINSGTLQIGDGGNDGSIGNGPITDGGTLTFDSANTNFAVNPAISQSGTLTFTGAGNYVVNNQLSGGGILNDKTSGTLTLAGLNSSYSANINMSGTGILLPLNNSATGNGPITIGAAQTDTCHINLMGNLNLANTIAIFPRAFGSLNNPAVVVNVSDTNVLSSSSPINIPAGGNLLSFESDSGLLTIACGITGAGLGRDLVLKGAGAGQITGNINQVGVDSVFIWKLDTGMWTLSGNNTPGAATTISNGTLIVDGTIDTNNVTVDGGELSGTGSIAGTVTVNSGGTISPGPGIGTLTLTGAVILNPGGTASLTLNKAALTNSEIAGATSIAYGGTLAVNNLGDTLALNDSFLLFQASSYSGAFSSYDLPPLGPGLAWNTGFLAVDGTLRVGLSSHPSFSPSLLSGTNLTLSGTGGSPDNSYSVLTSTNLAQPNSWTLLQTGNFDGSGNFSFIYGIAPGAPQRFFILRTP